MKKIAICRVAIVLLGCITGTAHAQFTDAAIPFDAGISFNSGNYSGTGAVKNFTSIRDIKALKNFTRQYENATDIQWGRLNSGGLFVHFYDGGIQTKIFYNKRGGEEAMIRYYNEDQLPSDVKQMVKSTYYGFNIFLVIEVTVGDKTAYLVKVSDEARTKTVRVMNREMEVLEEFENL